MAIEIGKQYRFTYPNYGTPDGYPDYTAHSGQTVEVVRKLNQSESENEMYMIKASDGWIGHADHSELNQLAAGFRCL